ncbi:MAG: PEGA domain-containing protein [Bradymonadia bacterium]
MCIAFLSATPAQLEQAKTLYTAGSAAYQAGNYTVAIDAFEATRAISERPVVIFSLAQAYRLRYFSDNDVSDLEAAIEAYQRYLEIAPEGPRKGHATQHLSTLVPLLEAKGEGGQAASARTFTRLIITSSAPQANAQIDDGFPQPVPSTFDVDPGPHTVKLFAKGFQTASQQAVAVEGSTIALVIDPVPEPAKLTLNATPGAQVLIDRREVGQAPLTGPLSVTPGPHQLVVKARGRTPHAQQLTLEPAQQAEMNVELEVTTQRVVSWSLLGGSAVLAGFAIWTGTEALDAESQAQDLEARLGSGITDAEFNRYSTLRNDRDTYRDATTLLGIGAAAALVGGVLLYIFDDPALPPSLTITPEGGAAVWRW